MFLLVFFDLKVLTVRTFKSKTVLENLDRRGCKSRNRYGKVLTVSTLKPKTVLENRDRRGCILRIVHKDC